MSLWRQLVRGLRVLANRKSADQDVSDEVQHYLDEAAASLEAEGLSSAEARRVARLQFGNTTVVREQIRSSGWENAISATLSDLRYSARQLGRNPGFAAVTVLTLALGIGACTAIFSAVNPILFEPLPYPHADRILMMSDFGVDSAPIDVTFGTYRELAARIRSFDALAAADAWQPVTTGTAQPERLDGQRVTFGYFRVLGVFPAVGRDFEESDGLLNAPKVAILSDGLVQRRFGGDHSIRGPFRQRE